MKTVPREIALITLLFGMHSGFCVGVIMEENIHPDHPATALGFPSFAITIILSLIVMLAASKK